MSSLFSNGPAKDFVITQYQTLIAGTKSLFVASPFVTITDELAAAAEQGKNVSLLAGLNRATDPKALRAVFGIPNLGIRYYNHRFHAKIYLFDTCALIGSSNLTDGGMKSNREATALVTDSEQLEEVRALSQELWSGAPVLTSETLSKFESSVRAIGKLFDPDAKIEADIGRAEPPNISTRSQRKSSEYIFLEALRRRVYEQFKPAFDEVTSILSGDGLHRPEWNGADKPSETNRFLNWVRLGYGSGDDWQKTPLRSRTERRQVVVGLGSEWAMTGNPRIADNYFSNLQQLRTVFAAPESLQSAPRDELSAALMGIHAFEEQIRFIKGGYSAIASFFWNENQEDVDRVKKSLSYLLFGRGEFSRRLYEILHFPEWKIRSFGESCALELSGTVHPEICPPMNMRSAKGLRYIGFDVPAA